MATSTKKSGSKAARADKKTAGKAAKKSAEKSAKRAGQKNPEKDPNKAATKADKKAAKKASKQVAKASKQATRQITKPSKKAKEEIARRTAAVGDLLAPVPETTEGIKDWDGDVADLLRATEGFSLAELDADATPGWEAGRQHAEQRMMALGEELSELQERLFAEGRGGGRRAVLLVLQGLDTAGKGGIVRHVIGMVDPQGVALRSFGVPTKEERDHHFLWRIDRALPPGGRIGVFDRSHYEDVLVARVENLAPPQEIEGRYEEIVQFERELIDRETHILKVALIVSPQEQYERLRKRLERPDKHWKFSLADLEVRAKRPAYDEAYQIVLDRTSIPQAPWYVIPADHKWYARLAVSELLVRTLRELDLRWPEASFDVAAALTELDAQGEEGNGTAPVAPEDEGSDGEAEPVSA